VWASEVQTWLTAGATMAVFVLSATFEGLVVSSASRSSPMRNSPCTCRNIRRASFALQLLSMDRLASRSDRLRQTQSLHVYRRVSPGGDIRRARVEYLHRNRAIPID